MPLSEHEQRLLDQIERALYQEDPKFASTVRQTDLRTHMRRRLRRAALVLALGFVLLLAGVVISQPDRVGVAGFVVMVGALLLAMTAGSGSAGPAAPTLHAVGSPERPAPPDGRPPQARPGRPAREQRRHHGAARGALEAPLGRARRRALATPRTIGAPVRLPSRRAAHDARAR